MVRLGALALVVFATACSSLARLETPKYASRIEKIEMPLQSLQQLVVGSLPVGLSGASSNGREFTSVNFILDQGMYKAARDALDRYWARILVLGDSRPYAVEVFVTREKRVLRGDDFTYAVVGHDSRLAKELAARIQEQLSKRREDRNIIDDFRVF